MIRRFLRPGFTASDLTSTCPVGVVAPGGGYQAWTQRAPVCRLLLDYAPVVYSLQLPYHGALSALPYHRTPAEVVASIDAVRALLSPLVAGRYTVYVGYSMGSLFLVRVLPHLPSHPCSPLIAIGSPLTLTDTAPRIAEYWRALAITDTPRLMRLHGPTYMTTVHFIIDCCGNRQSALVPSREEREEVVRRREVYWVSGDEDTSFPVQELLAAMREAGVGLEEGGDVEGVGQRQQQQQRWQRVWHVRADHFDFFKKETWPQVEQAIADILLRHAKLELLQPQGDGDQHHLPSAL